MSSRDVILSSLRRNSIAPVERPVPPAGIRYTDPTKQFEEAFTAVGGKFERSDVTDLDVYRNAEKVVSMVAGIPSRKVDVYSIQKPHELDGVDVAVIAGEFGVAENGAVWVPGEALGPHRAIFVIAQHLILVVPAGEIVNNMHEAYGRLRWRANSFGLFISGPSKTADIEQSLVIGAHGARSCTVVLR